MEQALRIQRGNDNRTVYPVKVLYITGYSRRGVSGFSGGYKKDPQYKPRGNGGHLFNPKDQAPGPIQDNNIRIACGEQEKRG